MASELCRRPLGPICKSIVSYTFREYTFCEQGDSLPIALRSSLTQVREWCVRF
jgi:hypothetical protein